MPREVSGVLAVEGVETGDGRMIDRDALTWGDGPWPLRWQPMSTWGHDNALVVGTITRLWRDDANIRVEAYLHDDSNVEEVRSAVARVAELIASGSVGVSIGFDDESVELRLKLSIWEEWQAEREAWEAWWEGDTDEMPERPPPEEKGDRVVLDKWSSDDMLWVFTAGRVREATIVDTGAIAEAALELAPDEIAVAASLGFAASLTAKDRTAAFSNPNFGASGDEDPRLVWQEPQRSEEPGGWGAPLTVNGDGTLYGHATLRYRCHGSFEMCIPPPDHGGDLSRFLIGDATGTGIPTGPLVLDTSHGVDDQGRVKSSEWLANTGMTVADVTAGFDAHGMWIAGRTRPGITARELAALRGSGLSAEWHPIGGKLRCVGVLAVNASGYTVQRVVTNERGIAAALFTLGATCCGEQKTLDDRVATLERALAAVMRRGV